MDWRDGRRSNNVDDARNSPASSGIGGLGLLLRFVPYLIGTKIGRIILLIGGLGYFCMHFLGVDTGKLLNGTASSVKVAPSDQDKELVDFVSVVLATTEDIWRAEFQKMGKTYQDPHLTLFRGSVQSGCGLASSATGPFYCPADNNLYIDLSFYQDLKNKLGAPGDFAQAYVIAHEVGHHVQNLLGISRNVRQAMQRKPQSIANALSVKQELQADCFAGIWAHYTKTEKKMVQEGDIEEALAAAAAVGDDKLQQQASGTVRPEKFTHGTSKQRAQWFNTGFESGNIETCNTFKN